MYLIYMYKQDLVLNNLKWLICHKTKSNRIWIKSLVVYSFFFLFFLSVYPRKEKEKSLTFLVWLMICQKMISFVWKIFFQKRMGPTMWVLVRVYHKRENKCEYCRQIICSLQQRLIFSIFCFNFGSFISTLLFDYLFVRNFFNSVKNYLTTPFTCYLKRLIFRQPVLSILERIHKLPVISWNHQRTERKCIISFVRSDGRVI